MSIDRNKPQLPPSQAKPQIAGRNYDLYRDGKLELSKQHKQDFIDFKKMDTTPDGRIDENEFYEAMNLQLTNSDDKAKKMEEAMAKFREFAGKDKSMDSAEYSKMMDEIRTPKLSKVTSYYDVKENYANFQQYVAKFDEDKDGKLSNAEYQKLAESLDISSECDHGYPTIEYIAANLLAKTLIPNKKAGMSKDEFMKMMRCSGKLNTDPVKDIKTGADLDKAVENYKNEQEIAKKFDKLVDPTDGKFNVNKLSYFILREFDD